MTTTSIPTTFTGPVTTLRPRGIEAVAYRVGTTLVEWSRSQTRAHVVSRESRQHRFAAESARARREQDSRVLIGAARR